MAEDERSLLLETLARQVGGGGETNLQELLLSRLDQTDPTMNLIGRYLAEQSRTEHAENDTALDDEEDASESSDALEKAREEERARSFQRLRRTMEQMYEEIETLRERNDTLAAALGACHLCWGENLDCPVCGGTGHPGSSMPDGSLLAELVAPAVRRLRKPRSETQRTSEYTNQREREDHELPERRDGDTDLQ